MSRITSIIIICIAFFTLETSSAEISSDSTILNLDGTWEIAFDPDNQGRGGNWHQNKTFSGLAWRRRIPVPSCWEQFEQDYEGVAFYRRTFVVPADWKGKTVRLHFDAVNYLAEVWLNDKVLGFHEGGFTPFELRAEHLLQYGKENVLILRVVGPILLKDKEVDGMGPFETPQWRGAITGGIWQPVRLIATGDVFVNDVFVEPVLSESSARVHLEIYQAGKMCKTVKTNIKIRSLREPGCAVVEKLDTVNLVPGPNQRTVSLKIPEPVYWSPENPHLYTVETCLSDRDAVSDRHIVRFGMRELTIRNKRFYLNGKPFYIKAAFFEGLYPIRLAYPDSQDMARREISLAKEAGFNMIRPWRKPPPPMWLDLAEEIGIFTVGSLPIECMDFPRATPYLPWRVENELRGAIMRDRNRACLVQWELFNEIRRPVLQQLLHPMSILARRLDPTRLILDESGGWAEGSNMYLPYEYEPIKFNDIHFYPGPFVTKTVYDRLADTEKTEGSGVKNVVPGLMSFISELGYGSLPDLVDINKHFQREGNPLVPPYRYHHALAESVRSALHDSGLNKVFPDLKQFCLDQQFRHGQANQRMIEAVRTNPDVAGYCIHAFTAGDWIIGAGLLDLFRNPKTYAYQGTRAANQPRILSIRVLPRNVYAQRGTKIEVLGVNEIDRVSGQLSIEITDNKGLCIFQRQIDTVFESQINHLFGEKLDTRTLSGTYTVRARYISSNGSILAENAYDFDVFPPEDRKISFDTIAVLGEHTSLKALLQEAGLKIIPFAVGLDKRIQLLLARFPEKQEHPSILQFVRDGGTAVYLSPVPRNGPIGLPFKIHVRSARGVWDGVTHVVTNHPVFDGLPTGVNMGSVYENVCAQRTLKKLQGNLIVGSVGWDWYPDMQRTRRHYNGTGDAWWGADLAVVPLGRGRLILSMLHLLENLGHDPVADKILFNLINWCSRSPDRPW